jgi:glycosyltransferase involved in cell wall biosynthesis
MMIVVVPAYNEAATIREVAKGILDVVPDLIVVDDGSTDGTAGFVQGLPLQLIRHETNRGKAAALETGFRAALERGGDAVLTLDGDAQHRAEDMPKLLAAHAHHPDAIIIGTRLHDKQHIPVARYGANRFANFWISWAAGMKIEDSQSGFRIYPATVLRSGLPSSSTGFVFESEVLIEAGRAGVRIVHVPVAAVYSRHARASHFHPVLDIARIVIMVAGKLLRKGLHISGLIQSLRQPSVFASGEGHRSKGQRVP